MSNNDKQTLTIKEAVEYINQIVPAHYNTVYHLIRDKKLPARKILGYWVIKKSDLDDYLEI